MFSLREYIKQGFLKAIGKMEDYQIILNSSGWHDKGVLTKEDLEEINEEIEAQYVVVEETTTIPTVAENETVEENNTEMAGEPSEEVEE